MKIKITFIGLLILGAGLLPLLNALNVLPDALSLSNLIYSLIITLIGLIGLIFDLKRGRGSWLSVPQKIVTGVLCIMTIAGGLYPLLVNMGVLSAIIPTKGIVYPIVIVAIGGLGILYGATAR